MLTTTNRRVIALDKRLKEYYARLNERLKPKLQKNTVVYTVDDVLCVYKKEHRHYTLNLMRNISAQTISEQTPVHIDLSKCPKITFAAAVMLFAEVSRARIATENDNIVSLTHPEDMSLHSQLESIGWIRAVDLGCKELHKLFDEDDTFQTVSDPSKAMISLNLMLNKKGINLTSPEVKVFTKGVNEAMLNVFNHAYSHESNPLGGIGRRWWQACFTTKHDGADSMVYVICDLGQGILNSLPKLEPQESTTAHICRAMSLGVTCTGIVDRGKGTNDMEKAT